MNELYHYGVLGMKWGVRKDRESSGIKKIQSRLQGKNVTKNPDGTITAKGIKGVTEATFVNQKAYDDWVNGKDNPMHTIAYENYANGKRTEVYEGSGYKLYFDDPNASNKYSSEFSNRRNEYIESKMDSKFGKRISEIEKASKDPNFDPEKLSKMIKSLETDTAEYYDHLEAQATISQQYYRIMSSSELTEEERDQLLQELEELCDKNGVDLGTAAKGISKTADLLRKIGEDKIDDAKIYNSGIREKGKVLVEKMKLKFQRSVEKAKYGIKRTARRVSNAAKKFANDIAKRFKK